MTTKDFLTIIAGLLAMQLAIDLGRMIGGMLAFLTNN